MGHVPGNNSGGGAYCANSGVASTPSPFLSTEMPVPAIPMLSNIKIFVGGLAQSVTDEKLRAYFEAFGTVVEAVVMRAKKHTGSQADGNNNQLLPKSRGFGFVTFGDPQSVTAVFERTPHVLDGKMVECRPACPRSAMQAVRAPQGSHVAHQPDRIFVGGLPSRVTADDLRLYFSRFGPVTDAVVIVDDEKRSRGFGFVTFERVSSVLEVIHRYHQHEFHGRWVEVKKALPREYTANMAAQTASAAGQLSFNSGNGPAINHQTAYRTPSIPQALGPYHGVASDLLVSSPPAFMMPPSRAALAQHSSIGMRNSAVPNVLPGLMDQQLLLRGYYNYNHANHSAGSSFAQAPLGQLRSARHQQQQQQQQQGDEYAHHRSSGGFVAGETPAYPSRRSSPLAAYGGYDFSGSPAAYFNGTNGSNAANVVPNSVGASRFADAHSYSTFVGWD